MSNASARDVFEKLKAATEDKYPDAGDRYEFIEDLQYRISDWLDEVGELAEAEAAAEDSDDEEDEEEDGDE